jgi:tRNA pseudouridine13 synthase
VTTDPSASPHATADLPGIGGRIRVDLDDFTVDEVPAYPPAGRGDHLFVRFEKRDITTREAVHRMARALGVTERDTGWAGMKDRHAITTQWASFLGATREAALALSLEGIAVREAHPHPHKLRTGHLRANRFRLVVRDPVDDAEARCRAILSRLRQVGCPNYFGEQRFGAGGENFRKAQRWLLEEGRPPRDRFERKLLVSVLQSRLFNEATARRVREGTLDRPIAGDLMRKEDTGGMFVAHDVEDAERRMAAWEISATGPMFGADMRWPEAEAKAREERLLSEHGLSADHLRRFKKHGRGTRRPHRMRPEAASVEAGPQGLIVAFTLPAGAFATVLMGEIMKPGEATDALGRVSQ